MPYRPNIKNADGSLSDLPLEAETAVKLKTARTIGLSGVTNTPQSFNGSENISIPITSIPASLLTGTGPINITGSSNSCTGNSATATKLLTKRSIGISGVTATSQDFDGSSGITIPITAVPANLVTGTLTINTSGSSGSCTGNAASATKLQTTRTIGLGTAVTSTATSFNGSANITIPITGINAEYLTSGTIPAARLPASTAVNQKSGTISIGGISDIVMLTVTSMSGNCSVGYSVGIYYKKYNSSSVYSTVVGDFKASFIGSPVVLSTYSGVRAANNGTYPVTLYAGASSVSVSVGYYYVVL